MELKTNYQYTYFIYPFAVKKENYKRYIKGLLSNKNFNVKFFDSFKDIELFNYFLPSIKKKYFQDFSFSQEKLSEFKKLSNSNRKRILLEEDCLIFEYRLDNEYQGKTGDEEGIFFKISKIELICFSTGICFLLMKTNIEDSNEFSDILNFNYKFSNLGLEYKKIRNINNIKIQTDRFNNMQEVNTFIEDITGTKVINNEIDIDENSFQTYTYACVDSKYWNKDTDFKNLEKEFIKFAEVYPSSSNNYIEYDKLTILANSNFMRLRINNRCSALICSSTESINYTNLAFEYENQYLYTYIIALHQRYYLKKLNKQLTNKYNNENCMEKLADFIKNMWSTEVTQEPFGHKIYKRCKEKLNLDDLYKDLKNNYDIFYKKAKIERCTKLVSILIGIMIICSILNISSLLAWYFFK